MSYQYEEWLRQADYDMGTARYPDDLAKIQAAYTEEVATDIITKSQEVLKWVKTQY